MNPWIFALLSRFDNTACGAADWPQSWHPDGRVRVLAQFPIGAAPRPDARDRDANPLPRRAQRVYGPWANAYFTGGPDQPRSPRFLPDEKP